jgi:hypothetical protein
MEKKKTLRIELTDEQKKLIKEATGKDAKAIEISPEDLEERITPAKWYSLLRLKKSVHYLTAQDAQEVHDALLGFRLATWEYKEGLPEGRRLGFIIDDVGTSPAVEAGGATVDLYGFASMAVAALQVQARQIDELRRALARDEDRPTRA